MNLQQTIDLMKSEGDIQCVVRKGKGGYYVRSHKGKNLGGPYKSKGEAEKRLSQVEYFKYKG